MTVADRVCATAQVVAPRCLRHCRQCRPAGPLAALAPVLGADGPPRARLVAHRPPRLPGARCRRARGRVRSRPPGGARPGAGCRRRHRGGPPARDVAAWGQAPAVRAVVRVAARTPWAGCAPRPVGQNGRAHRRHLRKISRCVSRVRARGVRVHRCVCMFGGGGGGG
jgi:hypothetical protein